MLPDDYMLLRNFNAYKEYFNTADKRVVVSESPLPTMGWYKIIDDNFSALEVINHSLYMVWNELKFELEDNYSSTISKSDTPNYFTFNLFLKKELVFKFEYKTAETYNHVPPFEYIDDEDGDWGLFLTNIVNIEYRKLNMINYFMTPG
jgi:hypothetical protein